VILLSPLSLWESYIIEVLQSLGMKIYMILFCWLRCNGGMQLESILSDSSASGYMSCMQALNLRLDNQVLKFPNALMYALLFDLSQLNRTAKSNVEDYRQHMNFTLDSK